MNIWIEHEGEEYYFERHLYIRIWRLTIIIEL